MNDTVVAQGLVKAMWSNDDTLTTRIDPAVAHYTGQAELAEAIQDGLAAKAAGDTDTATVKLGRAVQLAEETGNDEATTRLRKIVEIEDAGTGTSVCDAVSASSTRWRSTPRPPRPRG